MTKRTKMVMVYDLRNQAEVKTIKLHEVNGSTDSFVVASIWKNKNYNFAPFRMDELGRTLLDLEVGASVKSADIVAEADIWNARLQAIEEAVEIFQTEGEHIGESFDPKQYATYGGDQLEITTL